MYLAGGSGAERANTAPPTKRLGISLHAAKTGGLPSNNTPQKSVLVIPSTDSRIRLPPSTVYCLPPSTV